MATLETALSIFSGPSSPLHSRSPAPTKPPTSLKLQFSPATSPSPSSSSPCARLLHVPHDKRTGKPCLDLCFAVQEITAETEADENTREQNIKKKLYVVNLPWSLSVDDIKKLFGQCGTAKDVEEVSGRIIRVEFAKRFRRPPPPPPPSAPPAKETRHKLYVSNLAWKVRSTHLREFFSENFKPVSSRVVFESPSGRSAGYGFVSFATREEAEAAISALDGKELMGRPLRLKFSERNPAESESGNEGEGTSEGQPDNS
ncbi:31 kDa ribonucleoprotein, chloroplastic isoform X2 [Rhodamnia argentea]|uniref:31 kDa ribonucleoprotein, chloroplastic isoform X2 n=1 Tax=Rhodamnia argentea TaxID=178133 RepID=A0ABM3HYV1_9MYRT|nr:31 kDa ribonucleoprotein, chloroplastic isoform X2 [Rhodamnia argentea]